MMKTFVISIVLSLVCIPTIAQNQKFSNEQKEVLNVVNTFFKALAERDSAAMWTVMTREGQYYAVGENEKGKFSVVNTHKAYIDRLPGYDVEIIERIWDPTILVHEDISTLWAPYDLYLDGEFSHCGIDAFSLIKKDNEWKIAGTVFTIEKEDCPTPPSDELKHGLIE